MIAEELWPALSAYSETFTCYSSAIATWVAHDDEDWASRIDPGLTLTIFDAGDGLFGFAHFRPQLRAELGLVRTALDDPAEALAGVLTELDRSGRVIVAGDGFQLPWHVAHGRRHVPHWFVISGSSERPEVIDPFACRNDLGVQQAARIAITDEEDLAGLLRGLPPGDAVLELRERLALGDEGAAPAGTYQWLVHAEVPHTRGPAGASGPDALSLLATAFRERGQDPRAYAQADDIWSIARHRAFLARHAAAVAARTGEQASAAWAQEHGEPLARRWGHIAPLLMQAVLTLDAGRVASASVPDTLEDLATRERAAAQAFPSDLAAGSI